VVRQRRSIQPGSLTVPSSSAGPPLTPGGHATDGQSSTAPSVDLADETPDPLLLTRRGGFASHGEDAAIMALLVQRGGLRPVGFYVDVGAFHPYLFSNTAALHRAGWRGVNVEPNPAMAARLRQARPEDITLEAAVGPAPGRAELQMFSEWGSSNTLHIEFAEMIATTQNVAVTRKVDVEIMTLASVFEGRVPEDGIIDVLSVDVEGLDLVAMQSNDWQRFRPQVVAVEDLDLDLRNVDGSPIHRLMESVGYELRAHCVLTSLYVSR
jgi:FkbM family methyltransferase